MQLRTLGLQGATSINLVTAATAKMKKEDLAAILVTTGLTTAEQEKMLVDRGLTKTEASVAIATASQSAANTTATATTGALTAATGSLTASLKGLKAAFLSNPLTAFITIATTLLPLIIGISDAISDYNEKRRQGALEAASTYEAQKQSLSNTKKELDDLSSKYEKLSKGVDGLNQKTDLSNEEYAEYLDTCNKIGEMFPTLIQGYDSQGNAILRLKGNVELLTEAYDNLVISENNSLLVVGSTLFKDFKDKFSDLNSGFSSESVGFFENFLNLSGSELDDAIDDFLDSDTFDAVKTSQALIDAGFASEIGESWHDYLKRAVLENRTLVRAIVDDWNAEAEESTKNVKSLVQAYVDNSLLQGNYGNITDNMQNVISSIINSLDYEFYNGYDSIDPIYDYFAELLDDFNNLSSDEIGAVEVAFNAKTELNNGNCTVEEYLECINAIEDVISGFDEDTQAQIRLLLNDEEVKQKISALTDGKSDDFVSWINSLSNQDLEIAYKVSIETEDSASYGLDEWKNVISNYKIPVDVEVNFVDIMANDEFTDAIDAHLEKVNELRDAQSNYKNGVFDTDPEKWWDFAKKYPELATHTNDLSEAIENQIQELTGYSKVVDETGEVVSEASGIMAVLEDAFNKVDTEEGRQQVQAVMDKVLEANQVIGSTNYEVEFNAQADGFDSFYAAIKESVTATGLSIESIKNLKKRYKDLKNFDAEKLFESTANGVHLNVKALRELESEYEKLTKEGYDKELKELVDQYNDLTKQINNASDAAAASELYSKRSELLDQINDVAQLSAEYEGLTSAFHKWEEAQSTPDENSMYLTLSDQLEDIKELYEEGWIGIDDFRAAVQLMTDLDTSNMSSDELLEIYERGMPTMEKFFTGGVDGLLAFLNTAKGVSDELGKEWIKLDENGNWSLDLGVDGLEEFSNALNDMAGLQTSAEMIEILIRAMSAAGLDVTFNSFLDGLDLVKTKAEEANEALIAIGATDIRFDFSTTSVEKLNEQIEQAKNVLDSLYDENGEIKINYSEEDVENVRAVIESLVLRKQSLDQSAIFKVDISDPTTDLEKLLIKLKEYKKACNELERQAVEGFDTTEIQATCDKLVNEISAADPEITASLGIDTESVDTLNASIEELTPEMMVEAGLDASKIEDYDPDKDSIITYDYNKDEVDSWNFDREATLTFRPDWSAVENSEPKTSNVFTLATTGAELLASNMRGKAKAGGDFGAKDSGVALGGELGRRYCDHI